MTASYFLTLVHASQILCTYGVKSTRGRDFQRLASFIFSLADSHRRVGEDARRGQRAGISLAEARLAATVSRVPGVQIPLIVERVLGLYGVLPRDSAKPTFADERGSRVLDVHSYEMIFLRRVSETRSTVVGLPAACFGQGQRMRCCPKHILQHVLRVSILYATGARAQRVVRGVPAAHLDKQPRSFSAFTYHTQYIVVRIDPGDYARGSSAVHRSSSTFAQGKNNKVVPPLAS